MFQAWVPPCKAGGSIRKVEQNNDAMHHPADGSDYFAGNFLEATVLYHASEHLCGPGRAMTLQ